MNDFSKQMDVRVQLLRPRVGVAIAFAFFFITFPQLPLLGWHSAEENVNVATAYELKRDGHWKLPTLCGVPRDVKPPLPAWATASWLFRRSSLM